MVHLQTDTSNPRCCISHEGRRLPKKFVLECSTAMHPRSHEAGDIQHLVLEAADGEVDSDQSYLQQMEYDAGRSSPAGAAGMGSSSVMSSEYDSTTDKAEFLAGIERLTRLYTETLQEAIIAFNTKPKRGIELLLEVPAYSSIR